MAHDIISDALNQLRNASKANKKTAIIKRYSKLLISVLDIMQRMKSIESYRMNPENKSIEIVIGKLKYCRTIKPRLTVQKKEISKYLKRYLPARDYGTVILTTHQGVLTHEEAQEKNLGGSLIAFFY